MSNLPDDNLNYIYVIEAKAGLLEWFENQFIEVDRHLEKEFPELKDNFERNSSDNYKQYLTDWIMKQLNKILENKKLHFGEWINEFQIDSTKRKLILDSNIFKDLDDSNVPSDISFETLSDGSYGYFFPNPRDLPTRSSIFTKVKDWIIVSKSVIFGDTNTSNKNTVSKKFKLAIIKATENQLKE
ncbi:MAG: hypothetical protein OXH90_04745 [Paracoccaceae bacterium]|nr:hypothetical protein [Paracoccaceae bacterium]MDE2917875.1 hypothetical protein [Paracoccaceae bacterium]